MNILHEIIEAHDQITLDEIKTFIPKFQTTLQTCRIDVETFIENIYVLYREKPKRNRILANKLIELNEEIDHLYENVFELNNNGLTELDQELQYSIKTLEQLKQITDYLQQLYTIHESLLKINDFLQANEFLLCAEEIEKLDGIFKVLGDGKILLDALSEIRIQVCAKKQQLSERLLQIFQENIVLISDDHCYSIKILNNNNLIKQALLALYRTSDNMISYLDNITRFLWDKIFIFVVDYETEIDVKSDEQWHILKLTIIDSNRKSTNYQKVFENISTILEFLTANFNHKLDDDNVTTLNYIGRDLSDNLSELIIKHCLDETIPTDSKDLENCKQIIEDTRILETKLIASGILTQQTTSIFQYISNIDQLFINKKCQNYLLLATNLMKKDLHDMVEIGEKYDKDSFTTTTGFPHCSISKNVLEIIRFVENILQEAIKMPSEASSDLFLHTVKNIFNTYPKFVIEHHKKMLQTIPQQIALFYNNCTYLCHILANWQIIYKDKLPEIAEINGNFTDEIKQLQQISADIFHKYIENQIKQIEEIIKDSGLNQHQTLENVGDNVEKSLRQCLRQQELLKTVWHKVLSYEIYNKVVGQILDCLCNNLINSLIEFEDISATAAEQLLEFIKMIQIRGPKLFTDPNEINLFVKNWYKLNELGFILNASLIDINDRWANGKGPLALQFKPIEIRQLIRALFQNTERRAALLRKIHD